ncbi:hypothetical protein [Corallococcus exiguus]|uniref:hypothetical protein n=1 Tax=Corallococcus exiguus TaxID=83462 RepID=UPI003DA36F05
MVEQEVVRRMRALAEAGWGHKRIAREVGVASLATPPPSRGVFCHYRTQKARFKLHL